MAENKTTKKQRKVAENLVVDTRNELINKIVKTYELKKDQISEAVELYYDCQTFRIQNQNRERTEDRSPLTDYLNQWLEFGEKVIGRKLQQWVLSSDAATETKWAYDQDGIGPVLASGLAAHIDPERANTVSAVWKFAGLAPGFDRKQKGVKLPYNARLKVLAWKCGESFVKVSGKDGATYGKLYADFKAEELRKNEAGLYKDAADRELAAKKISDPKTKETLKSGKLIDAHLHARAKRRAVKIFLSHYWVVAREGKGLPTPAPYAEAILKHGNIIHPIQP